MLWKLPSILVFLLVLGCSTGSVDPLEPDPDIGMVDADGVALDAGGTADGGPDLSEVCEPETCEAASLTCGVAPDGCGGSVDCGPCVASILTTPVSLELFPEASERLDVSVFDDAGEEVVPRDAPTFSSDDPTIAAVDDAGVVTAVSVGRTHVDVTVQEVTARVRVDVLERTPSSVVILPDPAQVGVGAELAMEVEVRSEDGTLLPDFTFAWDVDNDEIATVSDEGVVTGVRVGTTVVRATSPDGPSTVRLLRVVSGAVGRVDVTPMSLTLEIGTTQSFSAQAFNASGQPIPGVARWSVDDPGIAQVQGSGEVTGLAVGATSVSVDIDGVVGTAAVTVTDRVVREIVVTPQNAWLAPQEQLQLTAEAFATDGTAVSCAPIWTSEDPSVASVDGSGLVTAVANGSTQVAAECENVETTVSVFVFDGDLPAALVDPNRLNVWLSAESGLTFSSGTRVSSWTDQSGNAVSFTHGTASRHPELISNAVNGRPALRFDGGQELRAATHEALADATVFVVAKNDDASHRGQLLSNCTSAGNNQFRYDGSATSLFFHGQSNGLHETIGVSDTTSWQVLAVRLGAGTLTVYQDGVQTAQTTVTVNGTWNLGQIGARCSSEFLRGHVAEILLYGEALTDAERQQIDSYLMQKYGIVP